MLRKVDQNLSPTHVATAADVRAKSLILLFGGAGKCRMNPNVQGLGRW
jgi:hypothetical protein